MVESLASYAIESVFVAGATDPDTLSDLCTQAGLRHVFVDLPSRRAPSVVSNNRGGAAELTAKLLSEMPPGGELYFLGGVAGDQATADRVRGFRETLAAAGRPPRDDQIITCGYAPAAPHAKSRRYWTGLAARLPGCS